MLRQKRGERRGGVGSEWFIGAHKQNHTLPFNCKNKAQDKKRRVRRLLMRVKARRPVSPY